MSFATVVNLAVLFVFFLFWLGAFFTLYHLTRFGVGLLPKRLAALFLVGALALFSTALLLYAALDLGALKALV